MARAPPPTRDMRRPILRIVLPSLLACVALAARASAQTHREIVRGTVTGDSGAVVRGALIVVTRLPDSAAMRTAADSMGRYEVVWTDGRGAYVVTAAAPGFAPAAIRIAARNGDSVIVANVRLSRRQPQQLAAVVSRAKRPVPDRDPASFAAGASEGAGVAQNQSRRLAPDQAGDIASLASLVPGVATVAGGGISVLGLSPAQNSATLNGLAFSSGTIPRDALTRVRVQTSTYDPANGWFSGAQTALDLVIGGQFTGRTTHWTLDAPALQYDDPVAARLGQRITNLNASVGGNGQLQQDRWAYNYGLQGGRKLASMASVVSASSDLLEHAGVAPDSVSRFLSALTRAGIPTSAPGLPSALVNDDVSFIGRIDHAPYDWTTLTYAPLTYGMQAYGSWNGTQAQGLSPVATPAHAARTGQATGSITGFYTQLWSNSYLTDLRTSVTASSNTADPYLSLPDGRALVASTLGDGSGGVSTLQFGGNSALNNSARSWRWETLGDVQFYPPELTTHRVKLAGDLRYDTFSQDPLGNRLGTYTYTSLADLVADRPASFTRMLDAPTRTGGEWNGFLSLGDLWRVNPNWQVLYGARVDANAFTQRPAYNPQLDRALGLRTDRAPGSVGVSPRIGFTWQNAGKLLRGGVGEFRNIVDPTLLAAPSVSTGLPNGLLRLACIGSAVPTPDWTAFAGDPATIPTRCSGSSGILADTAPNVQLVGSAFRPQASWRTNVGFGSSLLRWVYTIEARGSLNLDQPGIVDRNFATTTSFVVPVEGRPIFATPTAVVPGTGVVPMTLARTTASFGQVTQVVSNLRSRSGQLVLDVRPYVPAAVRPFVGDVDLAYTLTSIRSQERGFDGATFGDPNAIEWARGDLDARHQFQAQWVFRPLGDGRIITYGSARFRSGLPFTPMIGSDVNGDGLANDRAFVFAPSSAPDSAAGAGLHALLASGPASVRRCLGAQLDRAAGRNSCEGPWVASMNIGVRLSGAQLLHTPRADVTLNLTNPLGGLDQLLHGADHLHGWGTAAAPDPTLYTVRGFDPATNRFQYIVNPRFGGTSPSNTTLRAPFRLTLDVSIDIAPPMTEQQLERWLIPGRNGHSGTKLAAADFARRYARVVPDPYGELLQQSDSLLLSDTQVRAIQDARARYRGRVDAIWSSLGQYLAGLPDHYDFSAASAHTDQTVDDVWEITRLDVQAELPKILPPSQLALLGGWAGQLYRARDRVHIRLAPIGG